MSRRTVAVIQARMTSTRLPGKVLMPLLDMPLIVFMWRRVQRARLLDAIVLATSQDPSDDVLAAEALRHGLACHRGDLKDVLSRFAGAAREASADIVVRLTGDCPLVDADLIDRTVALLRSEQLDYASNIDPPTYPDGLDVEAFTMAALLLAHQHARLPSDREHVTPFIRNDKARFRQATVRSSLDLSTLRWTVDHADDLARVRQLLSGFATGPALQADRFDFLRALEQVPLELIAPIHARNEGYAASLSRDAADPA